MNFYFKIQNRRAKLAIVISVLFILGYLIIPMKVALLSDPYCVVIEDSEARLLSAQIAQDGQWRFPKMDSLPDQFVQCITTYEDKRFYYHFGIDPIAIFRAIKQNIKERKIVSGGSTITMQVMRMSARNQKRTIFQKIIEAVRAVRLESQYSKDEILKIYASHAPFGGNVVGLEAASWRYYNKSPFDLSWAQMATLAVLPNAPSLIRMDKNEGRLLSKRNQLLKKLYDEKYIDEIELKLAVAEGLNYGSYSLPHLAPHLLERAKKESLNGRITTNLNSDLQENINDLLDQHLDHLKAKKIHNGAVIILDTRTLKILSYVGNIPASKEEKAVDMIIAHRSSGSILKPFLYAAMIDEGLFTPDAFVKDVPIYIDGFTPKNYNAQFSGMLPSSEALSKSLNVPFVLMLQKYGVDKFKRKLNKIGLSSINKNSSHYGLSLILGGAEVSLDELTMAYAHMGRQLYDYDLHRGKYPMVTYPTSSSIFNNETSKTVDHLVTSKTPNQSFSAASIFHTFEAMRKVVRPNGFGDWELFPSSNQIAWKTGTSFGHRDAWAVGVHPEYTIGVWVGNADGEGRDEIIGASTAGKILFDAFDLLYIQEEWWATPYDDMIQTEVCELTGMLPSVHCKNKKRMWMSKTSSSAPICSYHLSAWTDSTVQYVVNQSCFDMKKALKTTFLKLSPLVSKYYNKIHTTNTALPPLHPNCATNLTGSNLMEMIYPNPKEKIFIPRDFNNNKQSIIAQVEHSDDEAEIYWYLNGDYLGATRNFHTMNLDGELGSYALLCLDQNGQRIERKFQIVSE